MTSDRAFRDRRSAARARQRERAESVRQWIQMTGEALSRSPGCSALFDRQGRMLSASEAWAQARGLAGKDYVGRTLQEMIPDLPQEVLELHRRVQQGEHLLNQSEMFVDSSGQRRWFHCEYRPYANPAGPPELYSVNAVEVTALFEARKEAQDNARRLELALDAARVGVLEIDLINETIWSTPEVEAILGQAPGYRGSEGRPWPMCHPDDRARLEDHIESRRASGAEPFEFRIVRPDGEVRWIEIHYQAEQADAGPPTKIVVLVIDIDGRKRQELALIEARAGRRGRRRGEVPVPGQHEP